MKLQARNIGTTERREHEGSFVYPSVTVCPAVSEVRWQDREAAVAAAAAKGRARDNLTEEYLELDPLESSLYLLSQLYYTGERWAKPM